MATKILIRQWTASQWSAGNNTLDVGELGYETDTYRLKIGRGLAWNSTPYFEPSSNDVIGPLSSLNTTDKTYIVNAINEVLGIAQGAKTASDTNTQTLSTHATNIQALDAAITAIEGNIATIQSNIAAMQALLNGTDPDYDSIEELANKLKAAEQILAGIDPATAISLYDGLDQLNKGTALDATQGKILNDALLTLKARVDSFAGSGSGDGSTAGAGVSWIVRPELAIVNGNQVTVTNTSDNPPVANWNGHNPVYAVDILPFTFPAPATGLKRVDAIVANSNEVYEVYYGKEGTSFAAPAILDNRLLAGYVFWGDGGGFTSSPDGTYVKTVNGIEPDANGNVNVTVTASTFSGFTEEASTSAPYTTAKATSPANVVGVWWNGVKQRKVGATIDYTLSQDAGGGVTVTSSQAWTGGELEIIYVATGTGGGTTDNPPSAPQNIVISNVTETGYTATANESTD